MPSSTDAALLEKIESLSFLRQLNDRLAEAPDFPSACAALVDLLWQERGVEIAAYFSVDATTRRLRFEAAAPEIAPAQVMYRCDEEPFAAVLAAVEPVVLHPPLPFPGAEGHADAVWLGVPLRVRGAATGVLCVRTTAAAVRLEEDGRVLAIAATSAALALDVSRNGQREEFVAMLRHDIANPLMTALGYADILADQLAPAGVDPTTLAALGIIKEQLRAISDLVANYLHMAAIDRGTPTLRWEPIDLRELVADVESVLGLVARDKGLTLRTSVACQDIRADRRQLQRVLTNLLSNAIKYTPAPGAVFLSAARDGDEVVIAVCDDGLGIAVEDQPRVFTKYARFHGGRGIPGTGLGLYLSKGIVEALGGTITVDSLPGCGSTFAVRLPADGLV